MLARAMAENRLMFVYLCVQPNTNEEWQFRKTVFNIIDNYSRRRMIVDAERDPDQAAYDEAQANLRAQLEAMPIFQTQNEVRRRALLRGDQLPYIQDDLIGWLELERGEFRAFYRYLSSFVHTGTISFYRMAEHGRGNGEENDYDRGMISGILDFAAFILSATSHEMAELAGLR